MESKKKNMDKDKILSVNQKNMMKPPLDKSSSSLVSNSLPVSSVDMSTPTTNDKFMNIEKNVTSYPAPSSSSMIFPDSNLATNNKATEQNEPQHFHAAFRTPESVSFCTTTYPGNNSKSNNSKNKLNALSSNFDAADDVPDSALCPPGSEATGRWTKKEHAAFTQALDKYGREWKKIAAAVGTRTVVQVRTHAQKYFQKLVKEGGDVDVYFGNPAGGTNVGTSDTKRSRPQGETKATPSSQTKSKTTSDSEDDYYYFDSEAPPAKRQTTYYTSSGSNISSAKRINDDDIPPPSPASCGKRKDAEISAVMSLVGSPIAKATENGIDTLAKMREAYRKPPPPLTNTSTPLSIINPNSLPSNEGDSLNPPDTPWDGEMLALESRQHRTNYYAPMNVATSKEQDDFLQNVVSLISDGDVSGLDELLKAAKLPEETSIPPIAGDINGDIFNTKKSQMAGQTSSSAIRCFSPRAMQQEAKANVNKSSIIADLLNRLDESGNSALHRACGGGVTSDESFHDENTVLEMCKLLVEYGASVSSLASTKQSCVHLAALLKYKSVVNLLVLKGCPVNAIDENGDCATHVAARLNDIDMLNILTNSGANCHVRNKAAKCALDLLDDCEEKNMNRHELRSALLELEPRLRTLILYHEDCLEHAARRESDWEGPDRLEGIMKSLLNHELFPAHEVEISNQFQKAQVELLRRVHSPEYIAFVNSLSKKVQDGESSDTNKVVPFTPHVQMRMFNKDSSSTKADINCDTSFSAGTLKAARRAAGAVAHAVDRVLLGRNRNAFCAVRPPGHHAGYRGLLDGAKSCGFCIFNNVAAGAFHALETHNCERVAIVDIDVHHGNGTEDIVRRYPNPSRIFFFSLHLYDKPEDETGYEFFPGSGGEDDTTHNIINVPLMPMWHDVKGSGTRAASKSTVHQPPRSGKEAYKQAISQRLIPALRAFSPDLILVSTGFDPAEGDVGNVKNEIGGVARGMDLSPIDFEWDNDGVTESRRFVLQW